MTKHKIKTPKSKRSKTIIPQSYSSPRSQNDQKPAFSLEFLSNKKDFGLDGITHKEKAELLHAIYMRSKLTWNSLHEASKEKLGYEIMDKSGIKGFPCNKELDCYEKCYVFRVNSKSTSRMIGCRCVNGKIFYVVLYDRYGNAYSHD